MKEVIFPGLNLDLFISNIAFKIGNSNIYWYGILITLAMALSIILMKKDDKKYNIRFEKVLYLFILLIPLSLLGARLYFVLFKLNYYIANPNKIFSFRDGGLAIYGGIIVGIITTIVYCKINKIKVLDMLDYIAPYLALSQSIGRWGNFFNVEAHGTICSNILRMGIFENGIYQEVHPTFLYESISTLTIFIILTIIKNKRKYSGQITYLYLALYALVRMIIEGLRTDSLMLGNIRVSQLLSLIVLIVTVIIMIYNKRINRGIKNDN